MKVQLIRPPLDSWYQTGQFENLVSVPVGLCLLAKKLKKSAVEVEVIDGLNLPLEETVERIRTGWWVGVTDIYPSHLSAMTILKEANEKGATTVVGGPNVTSVLAPHIVGNHDYVDYAIVGDGEKALPLLVNLMPDKLIPGLVYKSGWGIQANKPQNVKLNNLFDLEDLVNWDNFDPDNFFPLSSIRGCIKAEQIERCSFCSIDHGLKIMNPGLVWKQINLIHSKYGVNQFWESGDSFIVGDYPQRLLEARPKHLSHIVLKAYTSPQYITGEIVEVLRALNMEELFLGVESADDRVLEQANKGFCVQDLRRALDILEERGYLPERSLHVPFIYGLPGETPESAEETFKLAEEIVGRYPTAKVVASFPVPLPGNKLFENLMNHREVRMEYSGDLWQDDFFDYQELVRLQCKHFTEVTYETMLEKVEQTKALLLDKGCITSIDINR